MKWLATAVTRLLGWLPLRASRRCAAVLGWLMMRLDTGPARVTRTNLSLCFPRMDEGERERLARHSLRHTACLLFESGLLSNWPRQRLERLIVSETGRKTLDNGLRTGGVLMFVPHFGNWEFLCFALGDTGFATLYNPPRIRSLEGNLRRSRERFGARMYPTGAGGVRAIYRQLDAGGLACLLADQVPEEHSGVYAPFFGRPVLTATLAHRLIQRSHPTVMLGSARRVPGGFDLCYERLGDEFQASDPRVFAEAFNGAVETLARRDPAQYQWEYKRFRKQPEGFPPVYRKRRVAKKNL